MTQITQDAPRRYVMWQLPLEIEAWVQRNDSERHDEVWSGEVHMGPTPTSDHQELAGELYAWILAHWQGRRLGRVYLERNVSRPRLRRWLDDYRAPDLVLVSPARFARDRNTHVAGGPDVVVEIYSPGDESYDKMPFYFEIGVDEVWVIHRDTKVPQLFVRGARAFRRAKPTRGRWLSSKATGIEMRTAPRKKLALRLAEDHATEATVPEDW